MYGNHCKKFNMKEVNTYSLQSIWHAKYDKVNIVAGKYNW